MSSGLKKVMVARGVQWVEVPEAGLAVLCGCPADAVKHLNRRGLIVSTERGGREVETGPNAILLSDSLLQGGAFCNLAEFPILQMFYRQGMMFTPEGEARRKPLLIGTEEQVNAQLSYIQRGNYGLLSLAELEAAGLTRAEAEEMMAVKLRFAYGRIQDPREQIDTLILGKGPHTLRDGVTLERLAPNQFRFAVGGDSVEVDLNLGNHDRYESPYPLGYHNIEREYFAVIHNGNGDGWDPDRPCMGSILMFQGRVFLVDAGPNITRTLNSLGIGINELAGLFHTHCHDDHFAGLTDLFRSDHRLRYYATRLVRHSVGKKLSALLGMPEDGMADFFDIQDLEPDQWNDVDGLEVKPMFSPHPVETTIFHFRALWGGGYRSYGHLADIISLRTLEKMCAEPTADHAAALPAEMLDKVRKDYLSPTTVKKIDVGGGAIHGNVQDFRRDNSRKIILSHTDHDLTDEEKSIGAGAPFGTVDVLIPSNQDYVWRYAHEFLSGYFPNVPRHELRLLINNPLEIFNPQSTLLREGMVPESILCVITGNVEVVDLRTHARGELSSGVLIGEMAAMHDLPSAETYHAASFVRALRIPVDLYSEFVRRNGLFGRISRIFEHREFLQQTWLCREIVANSSLHAIAAAMVLKRLKAGETVPLVTPDGQPAIAFVRQGRVQRFARDEEDLLLLEQMTPGAFMGEEESVFGVSFGHVLRAQGAAEVYLTKASVLAGIPRVRWKLFESFQRRKVLPA